VLWNPESSVWLFQAASLRRLQGLTIARKVDGMGSARNFREPIDDAAIPVVTTSWVSPLVALTSNTPLAIRSTESL